MLAAMKEAKEMREGRPWPKNNYDTPAIVKLSELQIDPRLSSRAQRLASVSEAKFKAAARPIRIKSESAFFGTSPLKFSRAVDPG